MNRRVTQNVIFQKLQNICARVKNSYIKKSDNKKCLYKVSEFYRRDSGEQMVVAKVIDSPRGFFKLSAIDLALKRRDLLSGFSTEDIVNIVGLAATEKEVNISYKETNSNRYFAFLAMFFGVSLITSNVASSKLISVLGITMTGGTFSYPLAYILGDIITEVYGFKRARQLIWSALSCNILFTFFIYLTIISPPSIYWHYQNQYALILGAVPRIVIASMLGYWCGEFLNSYIIAKMKVAYDGQCLWKRIFISANIGITVDTLLFVFIAYARQVPVHQILPFSIRVYVFKVACELIFIPFTMWVINKLKIKERLDIFDVNTNFTPFSLDVEYNKMNNNIFYNQYLNKETRNRRPLSFK